MRAVILSHHAADPGQRTRYHAMASQGCQIWLAVPHEWHPAHQTEPFRTQSSDDGKLQIVPVHVRGSLPGNVPARWNTRTISRLLRDVRPDIVQIEEAPQTQAAAVTTAVARRLSLPTVVIVRDSVPPSGSIMQRRYARQTLRGAWGLIAVNGVVAGRYAEFATTRPMAVIADRAVRPPLETVQPADDDFMIGFAGRLVPERGLDLLFQACVSVHGTWHLTVLGSGPEQERLENLAERLGIAARVSWVGGRPASEWHQVWPTLHCLVVPSRTTDAWYDTGGHHVLEAMAHGVPVVAARSGVLPDIVGEGGITVPENDPAGLAKAIRELQRHPDRRRSLAQAARRRILQEFTEEVLARKTVEFWRRASSGSDAASP